MTKMTTASSKTKILVVDDDESILDAVALILEEHNFLVETVFKGEETYAKVKSFMPDVILLDVLMSGKDGREICMNLKKMPDTKDIPVIMISAHPSATKDHKLCGADDFLPKPFESSDLLEKIQTFVR